MQKLIEFSFEHRLESPNVKHHWGALVSKNKKLKRKIILQWLSIPSHLKTFLCEKPYYTVKIIRYSPKQMDYDNFVFSAKFLRDVLGDLLISGLNYGQSDDERYMTFQYEQRKNKEHLIKIEIYKNE